MFMFLLESPRRGDSNQYTQYTIFNIRNKLTLNYLKFAGMGFLPSDSNMSSNRRAISVRATEVTVVLKAVLRPVSIILSYLLV